MKKSIVTLSFAVIACMNSQAKVWTVSQDATLPAQYTTVQAAINATAVHPGDTIYINGSVQAYDGFNINKPNLTFIGAGYAPTKDFPNETQISFYGKNGSNLYITFDSTNTGVAGRGAKFIGLDLSYYGTINNKDGYVTCNNVSFSRCKLGTVGFYGSNWTITNCLIYGQLNFNNNNPNLFMSTNDVISNNIFTNGGSLSNSNTSTLMIANNLFFIDGSFVSSTFNFAIFSGNMIINSTFPVRSSSFSNITMNDNMNVVYFNSQFDSLTNYQISSCSCSNDTIVQIAQMLFTNVDQLANYTSNTYYNNYPNGTGPQNFTLQPGSPALNYHGIQVGIYGGLYPWVDNTGMAEIPYIQHMNVSSVVAQPGGQIQVNITPKTHK